MWIIQYLSYLFDMTSLGNQKTVVLLRCHIFNKYGELDILVIIMRYFMKRHIRYFSTYAFL